MKTHYFCKADAIVSNEEINPVVISISDEIPPMKGETIEHCEQFHAIQANQLAELLFESLPQGTFDRLLYSIMGIRLKGHPSVYRGKTTKA